jgi:cytochrome c biogenesis protein CcmG, thiol:disulfide interchange protein DsbE
MRRVRLLRRQTWRVLTAGLIVLLLGAVVIAISSDDGEASTADAAPDVTLEFFDGSSQQLSELRGVPVVLNFWASWCPACISEMPDFGEVDRRFGDRVEFIGVNMQEVDLAAAMELVDVTGVEYRLAHDRDGSMHNQFGGIAMPTTVFISADGAVERVHSGAIFVDDLTEIIEGDLLG